MFFSPSSSLWPGSVPVLCDYPTHAPTALSLSKSVNCHISFFLSPICKSAFFCLLFSSVIAVPKSWINKRSIYFYFYIKYNLLKHSLFLLSLTKNKQTNKGIFNACRSSHFEGMTRKKKLEIRSRGKEWNDLTHLAFSSASSDLGNKTQLDKTLENEACVMEIFEV